MPATVIVGLQWGDEGKGKATDFLAEQVRWVVRYQGGDNAGHTVVLGDEVFKLRLVPSGVLYPHITSVIANGVVVNPATLIGELVGEARERARAVLDVDHELLAHGRPPRMALRPILRPGVSRPPGPCYAPRTSILQASPPPPEDEPLLEEGAPFAP